MFELPQLPSSYKNPYSALNLVFLSPWKHLRLAMCRERHRAEKRVGAVRTLLVDVALLSCIAVGACLLFSPVRSQI